MMQQPVQTTVPRIKLRYGRIFLDLFLRPLEAQACAAHWALWGRGLSLVLVFSLAFALGDSLVALPGITRRGDRLAAYISHTVGTISYVDGRIEWEHGENIPATGHLDDFRIDIANRTDDVTDETLRHEKSERGLVIAHDDVAIWRRISADPDHRRVVVSCLGNSYIRNSLESVMESGGLPRVFPPAELRDFTRRLCVSGMPWLFVKSTFEKLKTIFFCVFFFTLFQMIFKRGTPARLGQIVSLGLHACLPPLIMAGIYGLTGAAPLEFETMFWIALVLYMIEIFFKRQEQLKTGQP